MWLKPEGAAISKLFSKPYWRRVWIIQEVVVAQNIKILCGKHYLDWEWVDQLYVMLVNMNNYDLSKHPHALEIKRSAGLTMVSIWDRW